MRPHRQATRCICLLLLLLVSSPLGCLGLRSVRADGGTWRWPRHALNNDAAITDGRWVLDATPREVWSVSHSEGIRFLHSYPVAADLDGDGRQELVIGVTDYNTPTFWLIAYRVKDGSELWRANLGTWFSFAMPVATDCNRDGQIDIILGTNSEVLALAGNDGSVLWRHPVTSTAMGMTVADVNLDGQVEVAVTDYGPERKLHLLRGNDGAALWSRDIPGSVYNVPTAADIAPAEGLEIIFHCHLYNPSGERLLVWDSQGNLLWTQDAQPSPAQQAAAPPELGYVPNYGYISAVAADFDADGQLEVGWGSRTQYYVLEGDGQVAWQTPLIAGHGVGITHQADGTTQVDSHGVGGPSGLAGAVGNLDADPALEVVLASAAECRVEVDKAQDTRTYLDVRPGNGIRVWDGATGQLEWEFHGAYTLDQDLDTMHEPILVDLTGDDQLDVLALSSNGLLYALDGGTGAMLTTYRIGEPVPEVWPYGVNGPSMAVVQDRENLIAICVSPLDRVLHAIDLATSSYGLMLPLIEKG